MAVAYHARNGEVDLPARLHVREKLLTKVARIAAEVVVRIDAHYRVEATRLKRQAFRKIGAAKQLLAKLKRVETHDLRANEVDIEAVRFWEIVRCCSRLCSSVA